MGAAAIQGSHAIEFAAQTAHHLCWVGSSQKLAQSADQKIPFVLLLLLGAPARIHRQTD